MRNGCPDVSARAPASHRQAPPRGRRAPGHRGSVTTRASTASAAATSSAPIVSGGARRTHVLAGRQHEQPFVAGCRDDVGGRGGRLGAEQEATSAHAFDSVQQLQGRRRAPRRAPERSRGARRRSRRRQRRPRLPRPGCRRTSSRGRPGAKAPAAPSATSSAPMGRPLARPFASATRSGRTPSCSKAKNEPVRPTPVCTSSKPRSGESSAAAATNSGSSGTTPPSPRIGSRRIRPTSSSTEATQRVDVVRRHEAHARDERRERLALRGLTGDRERAEGPAVEAALERDDARLARRLPCVLERRLHGLGAGVAEERLRSAEASRERRGELLRGLGAVQVRRVPEALELRLRRRERRRMAVPERDDRDPAAEVQVLAPVRVPDAAPVAAHDREVGPRIRRQEPLEPVHGVVVTRPPPSRRSRRSARRARPARPP